MRIGPNSCLRSPQCFQTMHSETAGRGVHVDALFIGGLIAGTAAEAASPSGEPWTSLFSPTPPRGLSTTLEK